MKCSGCGSEVIIGGVPDFIGDKEVVTQSYELMNKKLSYDAGGFKVPFYCQICGSIVSPLKAVRDVVLVYPKPLPEKVGKIVLPEGYFVGGITKEKYKEAIGVIISVGLGHFDRKKKEFVPLKELEVGDVVHFEKRIPKGWRLKMKGTDGKEHEIMYCGEKDIKGLA